MYVLLHVCMDNIVSGLSTQHIMMMTCLCAAMVAVLVAKNENNSSDIIDTSLYFFTLCNDYTGIIILQKATGLNQLDLVPI